MALDGIAIIKGATPAVASARSEAPPEAVQPKLEPAVINGSSGTAHAAPPPNLSPQIEKLTRALQESQSSLSFSVDESTGKTIVRVVRSSTGELVRQIPSEEAIASAASLSPGAPLSSLGIDRWS
jgi:flagellar protein FlaG